MKITHGAQDEILLANKADRKPRRLPFAETDEEYEALMGQLSAMRERPR
jgi:hypothetical protein